MLEDHTYPDGSIELIFNLDTRVYKQPQEQAALSHSHYQNLDIELVGQLTKPYQLKATGRQLYFGVRFYPHSFSAFTPADIYQFNDQTLDERDFFSNTLVALVEQCYGVEQFDQFVVRSNHFFKEKINEAAIQSHGYRLVENMMSSTNGLSQNVGVTELAQRYTCSERWLQMQFKKHVGLTPKTLQTIRRFSNCLYLLGNSSDKLTSTALLSGYFDQAHFNREFKRFSGKTPSTYQILSHLVNQYCYQSHPFSY